MNTITMKIELCQEDRQRLDDILAALKSAGTPFPIPQFREKPQEPAQEPAGATQDADDTQPTLEATQPTPAEEPAKTVKLADIQKKVVDLSTAGKRDAVKEIIQAYAPRVSALPEDKLVEVWEKLEALNGRK